MTISMIAAMARNRVIGRDGQLPWSLPDDMAHFMKHTRGHAVIMGRRTFDTLDGPLTNRNNIILTRQRHLAVDGATIVHTLDQAIAAAGDDDEPFIAGGEDIYRLALPRADRIYLTVVHASPNGDTRFPPFDASDWQIVENIHHPTDDRHTHAFDFLTYQRIDRRH
ncbi:MAG: diacylglycerol kinase [Planctomycetaceae bacterium]|nr:diacylglycerol kinase [Planctomycetaceae bacterium]